MAETKICSKCGLEKPLSEYHKARDCKYGVRAHCKACACGYAIDYHYANRAAILARTRERRQTEAEETRAYHRRYYAANTEKRRAYFRKWRAEHPDRYRASAKKTHEKNSASPKRRLEASIRAALQKRLSGQRKTARSFDLLGYSAEDLMLHLERQFGKGMTWANYGDWHVDHVLPLKSFKYETSDDPEFRSAWALANLSPMWGKDNLKKGAKRLTLL